MEIQNYTVEDFICDESFQHYCQGSNQKDLQFWDNWIKDHPEKSEAIQEAMRIISLLNAKQGNLRDQSILLKDSIKRQDIFKETLQNEYSAAETPSLPALKRSSSWYKYAAGIAASLLLIFLANQFIFKPRNAQDIKNNATLENLEFATKKEPRKTIVLADGSIITLASASSISLTEGFSPQNRELTLSGEAFFDIKHDSLHPFKVHTAKIDIEVLGTIFNVKAYPGDEHTETSLFTGKVAVSFKDNLKKKIILRPNEKMIFDNNFVASKTSAASKIGNPFNIIPVTKDSANKKIKDLGWVHNRLKIEDEPLVAIAAKLQKWYGINITFSDDKVKNYQYTGTFESETVVQALEALQLSYPFTFKIDNSGITISQ